MMSLMGNSTTLTIRIDEDLKHTLEQAAAAEDRTVTDFIVRAVKARMAPQCLVCGRSQVPTALPAGLTPAMDAFLDEVKAPSNRMLRIVLTTYEGSQPRAYCGRVRFRNEDNMGAIVLEIGDSGVGLPVPRGLITGWSFDQEGEKHARFLSIGYANGNALVEHVVAATRRRR